MSVSNRIVLTSVIFTTLFTIIGIIMQFVIQQEISPTLTTCVFAYWAVELGSLAMIKRQKLKVNQDSNLKEITEGVNE